MNGSPNTSSGTLPRNGSSSANSSAPGLPLAIISEFWNTEWVRSYEPYMMDLLVHSKSKAQPSASRSLGLPNFDRLVLMNQPCAPDGVSSGITSRLTRPSLMAGKLERGAPAGGGDPPRERTALA